MKYGPEKASDGTIYEPSSMMIGSGIEIVIRLLFQQFERF
jgi:hypothetical protein